MLVIERFGHELVGRAVAVRRILARRCAQVRLRVGRCGLLFVHGCSSEELLLLFKAARVRIPHTKLPDQQPVAASCRRTRSRGGGSSLIVRCAPRRRRATISQEEHHSNVTSMTRAVDIAPRGGEIAACVRPLFRCLQTREGRKKAFHGTPTTKRGQRNKSGCHGGTRCCNAEGLLLPHFLSPDCSRRDQSSLMINR